MLGSSKTRSRRRRRLRLKKSKLLNNVWTVYQNNIRGFDSKCESFKAIIKNVDPSVVILNETHYKSNRQLVLPGFKCYTMNRVCKDGGGVASCVKMQDSHHTLKIHEGENGVEMLVTRHDQFIRPVNILNVYGLSECRSRNEKIQEQWDNIREQIQYIQSKGEALILFDDMNAHIGDLIPGNRDKISYGGKLIREFLENDDGYCLVNAEEKVINGPFTRVDPVDETIRSVLDICIVSRELLPYIVSLKIDKNREFTAFRPINKTKLTYSDHYALLLTFAGLPLRNKHEIVKGGERKIVRWNTNREGSWERFKELTTDNDVLNKMANVVDKDPEYMMRVVEKELTSIKFEACLLYTSDAADE